MRNIGLLLLVGIIALGCVKEQAKSRYAKISFNVDSSLLGEEHICSGLGIVFKPPINWDLINPDLLDSIKKNIIATKDSSEIKVTLINVFINSEKTFTCFVSTFDNELSATDIQENYLDEFRLLNQDLNINEGSFSHNELDFYQITFVKDNYITIKLIAAIDDQNIFMIDYIVPFEYYEEELRAIESSIGTIKIN